MDMINEMDYLEASKACVSKDEKDDKSIKNAICGINLVIIEILKMIIQKC